VTTKAVVGFRRICVAALASALVIFAGAAGGSASSSGSKPKVVPDSALSGIILQISDVPNGLEPISEATGPVALGKLYTGKRARKLVGLGYRSGRETGFATPESVVRGTTAVDQLPHGVLHLFSIGTTFRDAAGASAALALERKWLIAIFRGMGDTMMTPLPASEFGPGAWALKTYLKQYEDYNVQFNWRTNNAVIEITVSGAASVVDLNRSLARTVRARAKAAAS